MHFVLCYLARLPIAVTPLVNMSSSGVARNFFSGGVDKLLGPRDGSPPVGSRDEEADDFVIIMYIILTTTVMQISEKYCRPTSHTTDAFFWSVVGRRPLRSNSNDMWKLLLVPRTHNKLGDRSFSAAGLRLWNNLPPGIQWLGLLTFDSYRQSLKTHLLGDRSA